MSYHTVHQEKKFSFMVLEIHLCFLDSFHKISVFINKDFYYGVVIHINLLYKHDLHIFHDTLEAQSSYATNLSILNRHEVTLCM